MQPRLELMSLGKIRAAIRNPKTHDLPGIAASIRRFGFKDFPTLNEATGRLVEGHGRLIALKAIKKEGPKPDMDLAWPPENVVEKGRMWLCPVVRGQSWKDDIEAAAYLAGHNQLTMASGWDNKILAELFREIGAVDDALMSSLGFDDDFIDTLVATEGERGMAPPPGPPKEFPEAKPGDMNTPHECPKCGFEF